MQEDCISDENCIEDTNKEMNFGKKIAQPISRAIH